MKKSILSLLIVLTVLSSTFGLGCGNVANTTRGEGSLADVIPVNTEFGEGTIHFLPVGQGNATILESGGKFALVDFGSVNIIRSYELGAKKPIDYLKSIAGDENGKVHLEFIVVSHLHTDHVYSLTHLLVDPDVTVDTVFMRRYDASKWIVFESVDYGPEYYRIIRNACLERGFNHVQDIDPTPFKFGSFTVEILNGEYDTRDVLISENDNSLGVLLELDGYKTFLSGDINNHSGDEDILAPIIGKVDILSAGHHGFAYSNTPAYLATLNPDCIIVTNHENYAAVEHDKLYEACNGNMFYTGAFDQGSGRGVIKAIFSEGEYTLDLQIPLPTA